MTDKETTTEETPDSIADDLRAALKAHEEPATSETTDDDEATQEASEADDKATDETSEEETKETGDDEPAKEAASSEDAAEGADSEKDGEDESDPDEDGDETPEAAGPPVELPPTLSDAHKATLQTLPREAQQFLTDRYKEMEANFTRKTTEIAELRKTAEAFNATVEPYKAYIASLGTTPTEAFKVLMGAEYQLRNGTPEQKSRVLAQLAKDYGVSLSDLAGTQTEDDEVDPVYRKVDQRLSGIERSIAQQRQQTQAEQQASLEAEIKAFSEAVDEQGNLKHPHFDKLRVKMGALMQAADDAGEVMGLQTAYDEALWAHSELRQQQLAKEREAALAETKAKQEAARKAAEREKAEKVKKAKKAAAGVTTKTSPVGKPAKQDRTLHDEIADVYNQLSS